MTKTARNALWIIGAVLLLCMLPMVGMSAEATSAVSYTKSTTYTDGTPLPAGTITGHRLLCRFTPPGGTASPCVMSSSTAGSAATSISTTLTYPATGGQACFQVITMTATVESDPSVVTPASCKAFAALVPSAPTNVSITVTLAISLQSDSPIKVTMAEPVITRN